MPRAHRGGGQRQPQRNRTGSPGGERWAQPSMVTLLRLPDGDTIERRGYSFFRRSLRAQRTHVYPARQGRLGGADRTDGVTFTWPSEGTWVSRPFFSVYRPANAWTVDHALAAPSPNHVATSNSGRFPPAYLSPPLIPAPRTAA